MNPARQNILNRVRTALRASAPRPMLPTASPVWPPVGNDLMTRFRDEFAALRGEWIDTPAALDGFLNGQSVCGLDTLRQYAGDAGLGVTEAPLLQADIGVTGCECLVAQTGSVVISTLASGGRALSVFPPVHLVVARRSQLVADLPAAMALLRDRYPGRWPSQLSVVTGPSRTSDIEKVLVLGAHGPKRLAVYVADA
jgi:L-lactate dehydrogenase complex protein LldG